MAAPKQSGREGILGGIMVTLVAEGIALPAGLVTAAVLTRGLGPETYGSFIVVATTVATFEWLLIAIYARAVVKFVAEAEDWPPVAATAFRAYVLSGLAIAAAILLLAGPVASALNDPSLARYFRMFAPEIPLFALGAGCKGVLAGRGRYRAQAFSSACGWTGRMVFIVLFVSLGWGLEGAILGSISGTAVGALVALTLAGSVVWGRSGLPIRDLYQLALPAFFAMLFARLLDQVGIWSLETFGNDAAEVGFYGAAMNVLMVTSMIAAAVTPALVSTLSAARHAGDHHAVERVSRSALRFGLALFPFAAIVAGASPEIVPLLFGIEFSPAAPLMALLIVGAIARANVVLIAAMLVSLSRAWTAAVLAAPLPLFAVVAHSIAIPRFGALGAARVSAALAVVGAIISLVAFCWIARMRPPLATIARSGAISAAAWVGAASWSTPGPLLFAKLALLAAGVLLLFVGTGELGRDDLAALRNALPARG
jgi:O-antigen/teichoic acid export membrane protein